MWHGISDDETRAYIKKCKRFFRNNVLANKDAALIAEFAFRTLGSDFLIALIFRNLMMRTLLRNTTTTQIPHVRAVPISLRNASFYAWSLFTRLTSKGFFGLYLYLYLYLYSNDRW